MIVDIQELASTSCLLFKLLHSGFQVWRYTVQYFRRESLAVFFCHLLAVPFVSICVIGHVRYRFRRRFQYAFPLTSLGCSHATVQEIEGSARGHVTLDKIIKRFAGSVVSRFDDD